MVIDDRMDDKSLEISVYNHFKDYFNTRGVGIITDKQFVLYTQYNLHDGFNHDSAMPYLDKKIYPFKHYEGYYKESKDIAFASSLDNIFFLMPEKETISKNQQYFLNHIIDEIDRYNSEADDINKIKINIFSKIKSNSITTSNVNEIKKVLRNYKIRDNIIEKEEVIIGKTLNDVNAYTQILSDTQIQLLNELGISTDNIPESLLTEFENFKLSSLENDYLRAIQIDELNAKTLNFENICIKNIIGTKHSDYSDTSIIDAFAALKRGNAIIEKQKQHPDYYATTLKDKNRKIPDEMTVVERDGKYYITQGNNRLITQLVSYLAEREKLLGNEQALNELDEKYTFYLKCAKIPDKKEEMIMIDIIKQFNKDIIIKKNTNDNQYEVLFNNQQYTLKDINDIENFVNNLIDNYQFKNGKDLNSTLTNIMVKYNIDENLKRYVEDMEFMKRLQTIARSRWNKFKSYKELLTTLNNVSFNEISLTLSQKNTDDFIEYFEKIENVNSYKELEDMESIIPNNFFMTQDEKQFLISEIAVKKRHLEELDKQRESRLNSEEDSNTNNVFSNQDVIEVDELNNNEDLIVEKKNRESVEHDLFMERYKELILQGYRPDKAERIARLVVREEMKTYDKGEQIKETMKQALLEEKNEEAVQASFIIDKEDRNLCKYKLEKVNQSQRIILDSFDFKYDEKFQNQIMQPILVSYAECIPTIDVNIKNQTSNSELDTSNLVVTSENNNILNIENIETVHANNISVAIQQITPTVFEQQQEQKKVVEQQNEGTVLSRKLGTENSNHGYINLFILTVVVTIVCLAFIFLGILLLE